MNWAFYAWLPKLYVFDSMTVAQICNNVLARHEASGVTSDMSELFKDIRTELAAHYGDKVINEYDDDKWVFNYAGGAMGQMLVLHASISEYLIFFGSAVGTEGHSGVHFADDYTTVLCGEQKAALPHQLTPEVYTTGMTHHMKKGEAKQYSISSGTFILELAQGWIPTMLPFGLLDTFTSTMDFYSLYRTIYIYTVNTVYNLLRAKI